MRISVLKAEILLSRFILLSSIQFTVTFATVTQVVFFFPACSHIILIFWFCAFSKKQGQEMTTEKGNKVVKNVFLFKLQNPMGYVPGEYETGEEIVFLCNLYSWPYFDCIGSQWCWVCIWWKSSIFYSPVMAFFADSLRFVGFLFVFFSFYVFTTIVYETAYAWNVFAL